MQDTRTHIEGHLLWLREELELFLFFPLTCIGNCFHITDTLAAAAPLLRPIHIHLLSSLQLYCALKGLGEGPTGISVALLHFV